MEIIAIKVTRSDGQRFLFESEDWGVCELIGIEFPEVEVFTANRGLGNGALVTGKRKKERTIELHARQRGRFYPRPFAIKRAQLLAFLNPNYTFTLDITVLDGTKQAKNCELLAASYPTVQVNEQNPELVVQWMSTESDLYASEDSQTSFTSSTPMWHVTRIYEFGGGTNIFGKLELNTLQTIYYTGTEPTPIVVTVRASGYTTGLRVSVDNVVYELEQRLDSGDVLIIDSENRTVTLNGTPLAPALIDTQKLRDLLLQVGDNTVEVDTLDGSVEFTAELNYTGRYGGV